MTDKISLRRRLRVRRAALACCEEGALRSRLAQERLLQSSFWQASRRVALYVSVKGETGTEYLLAEAIRSGRELFLPRCRARGEEGWPGVMDFIQCRSLKTLIPSAFGIPEPSLSSKSRILAGDELFMPDTLIVVPALAFDGKGFRLGYGGGYYDRLLASSSCPSVGLAFDELLLDELPHEAWDRPVQAVCTEEKLLCL